MNQSIQTEIDVSSAFLNSPPTGNRRFSRPYSRADSNNDLAKQLRMVAAMIRASNQLDATAATPVKRQIFFVAIGGFDTHGNEFWEQQPTLNGRISKAINAFWTAMGNVWIRDAAGTVICRAARRTVSRCRLTMTDFGRTLDSNGAGSDHGWGSHHFVLGGAVQVARSTA